MLLISHRGNISGRKPSKENTIPYIKEALKAGYYCEIDVWMKLPSKDFYLGHDKPDRKVSLRFLQTPRLILHAKNEQTFIELLKLGLHCFFHTNESIILTSHGWIWKYPTSMIYPGTIVLFPERFNFKKASLQNCAGICSDRIRSYK
jgi:hypothetical protein